MQIIKFLKSVILFFNLLLLSLQITLKYPYEMEESARASRGKSM